MRLLQIGRAALPLVLAALLVVTGCSSDDGGADTGPSPNVPSASSVEDQVIDVVQRYWDERVRVEGSGDYASADFEDILGPGLHEAKAALYDSYAEIGHRRVGAPLLRDLSASVEGSTAVVTMCVNEGPWTAEADVATVEQPVDEFYAIAFTLERGDDGWLMVDEGSVPPGDVVC